MDRESVIKMLCALVSQVGKEVFHHELEHDCFCGEFPGSAFQRVHPEVVAYICNAVSEKIKRG